MIFTISAFQRKTDLQVYSMRINEWIDLCVCIMRTYKTNVKSYLYNNYIGFDIIWRKIKNNLNKIDFDDKNNVTISNLYLIK